MIYVSKGHYRVSVPQQALKVSPSIHSRVHAEERVTLQVWSTVQNVGKNHVTKTNEGKRKSKMINRITARCSSEPSLFPSGHVGSSWTGLISQNLSLCFALLSLFTDVCKSNELSVSEPVHSGWPFVCYSLIIARERSYLEKMKHPYP